jgi:hypothetical protein
MSFDDYNLLLSKPGHVDQDDWEHCYARYSAALALHNKTVKVIRDQLACGVEPTEKQYRGEEAAYEVLEHTRNALLELSCVPSQLDVAQRVPLRRDS